MKLIKFTLNVESSIQPIDAEDQKYKGLKIELQRLDDILQEIVAHWTFTLQALNSTTNDSSRIRGGMQAQSEFYSNGGT